MAIRLFTTLSGTGVIKAVKVLLRMCRSISSLPSISAGDSRSASPGLYGHGHCWNKKPVQQQYITVWV
ncbi:MAG TPA: hypothetical protein PLV19_06345 [Nitrosomonas sp.]|nr:hypothetical protein [Nitrosomonas sp.]HQX13777.1 hypothetical protein [Nitrosomonas sp.]HRB33209.1 hypothetical protein [Nitrosomonas sp.]HRB45672.1 hypothetical protein [Nitrosomonas sp.]HRB77752.1 hypothetical protein [Nitrosomonas sp.]